MTMIDNAPPRGLLRTGLRRLGLACRLIPVGLLAAVALAGPRPALTDAAPFKSRRYEIELEGKLSDVSYEDFDGDGLLDMMVIRGREIQVFFQDSGAGFRGKPDQKWKFDRRAVIFDTADIDGDKTREIVFLAADGLYSYDLAGGRRFRLLRRKRKALETLTRRPSSGEIRRKDLCRDLDGDGRDDLVIPEKSGLGLYLNKGGTFGDRMELFSPPSAAVDPGSDRLSSQLRALYWFSNPSVVDYNRDGLGDLLLPVDDQLRVFRRRSAEESARRGGKIFPNQPDAVVSVPFQRLLAAGERPGFDLDLTLPMRLVDLNHDGYVDLISTHIGQGTTRIFLGSEDTRKGFQTPAQTIRANGVAFFAFLQDLDGDGLDDLIVPRTDKIGIWSILKVLVTRSVPVDVLTFYQRKDGDRPFPAEPDDVGEIEIPVLFQSKGDRMSIGTSFLASISGDFNGDGRKDVLFRTAADEVGLYYAYGDRRGYPERDNPSAILKVLSVEDYRFVMADVPDLNGDGKADVVLKYYSWDRKADRMTIYISEGGTK